MYAQSIIKNLFSIINIFLITYLLIDRKIDDMWNLLFIKYVFEAIETWEKRVKVQSVTPVILGESVKYALEFEVVDTNQIVRLEKLWK